MTEVRMALPIQRSAYSAAFDDGFFTWQIRAWVYDATAVNFGLDTDEGTERVEVQRVTYEGGLFGGQADLTRYTDGTVPLVDTPFVMANVATGFGASPDTLQLWQFTQDPRVVDGNWVHDYAWEYLALAEAWIANAAYVAANGRIVFNTDVPSGYPVYVVLTAEIGCPNADYADALAAVTAIVPVVEHVQYVTAAPASMALGPAPPAVIR